MLGILKDIYKLFLLKELLPKLARQQVVESLVRQVEVIDGRQLSLGLKCLVVGLQLVQGNDLGMVARCQ